MKLVGLKHGVSKKSGEVYEQIFVEKEFSEKEKLDGSFGNPVEMVFCPASCLGKLKPEHIGKEIRFDYEITGNYAKICGVEVKK